MLLRDLASKVRLVLSPQDEHGQARQQSKTQNEKGLDDSTQGLITNTVLQNIRCESPRGGLNVNI